MQSNPPAFAGPLSWQMGNRSEHKMPESINQGLLSLSPEVCLKPPSVGHSKIQTVQNDDNTHGQSNAPQIEMCRHTCLPAVIVMMARLLPECCRAGIWSGNPSASGKRPECPPQPDNLCSSKVQHLTEDSCQRLAKAVEATSPQRGRACQQHHTCYLQGRHMCPLLVWAAEADV